MLALFTQDIFRKSREIFKSYILIFTCSAARDTHLTFSESSDMLLLAICKNYHEHSLVIILI